MHLFSTRLRNSSTHIPDNARCSANRSFRRLFSGSVLMRLLMSWMVDYVSTHRHACTLLSCVDSRKRFAAALRRATRYRSHTQRTARGQNVLVLVLAPDRVVVVQQHLARLLRALRPVLELRLTPTPHGYFATLADGQQVHRHGLRVTLPHRGYLVVYGVEQRHQRVERSVHQQQLSLLRVTPDGIGDLLQHGLVVGDVLEHLRDDHLVPEGTYSSNKSAMSAHGYCFWKCTRGLMPRFTQMSTI